jgi:tripartite-type tricarboxylate transporter receptor subunit TctC
MRLVRLESLAAFAALCVAGKAPADEVAQFYTGRQVTLLVGAEAGGGTGATIDTETTPRLLNALVAKASDASRRLHCAPSASM